MPEDYETTLLAAKSVLKGERGIIFVTILWEV
jgi:hypothetical protein